MSNDCQLPKIWKINGQGPRFANISASEQRLWCPASLPLTKRVGKKCLGSRAHRRPVLRRPHQLVLAGSFLFGLPLPLASNQARADFIAPGSTEDGTISLFSCRDSFRNAGDASMARCYVAVDPGPVRAERQQINDPSTPSVTLLWVQETEGGSNRTRTDSPTNILDVGLNGSAPVPWNGASSKLFFYTVLAFLPLLPSSLFRPPRASSDR
jgi:hypothetical protein